MNAVRASMVSHAIQIAMSAQWSDDEHNYDFVRVDGKVRLCISADQLLKMSGQESLSYLILALTYLAEQDLYSWQIFADRNDSEQIIVWYNSSAAVQGEDNSET